MLKRIPVKINGYVSTFVTYQEAESWVKTEEFDWENEDKDTIILKSNPKSIKFKGRNNGKDKK